MLVQMHIFVNAEGKLNRPLIKLVSKNIHTKKQATSKKRYNSDRVSHGGCENKLNFRYTQPTEAAVGLGAQWRAAFHVKIDSIHIIVMSGKATYILNFCRRFAGECAKERHRDSGTSISFVCHLYPRRGVHVDDNRPRDAPAICQVETILPGVSSSATFSREHK